MKFLAALVLLFGLAAANGQNGQKDHQSCHNSVIEVCRETSKENSVECNALMGGFEHVEGDLETYVNHQLDSSYKYLLLGTHFNSYQKNRPGFHKLFQGLSDKAWDKAVELIKHIAKRGGKTNLKPKSVSNINVLEVNEMHALSIALDIEKKLATSAHHIHRKCSHLDSHKPYDPEIAQFIEEEFLEYQTDSIRKISGYANDLSKLIKVANPSLNVYLFDEYLAKQ